jgi:Flp pilus assembly protein TadB
MASTIGQRTKHYLGLSGDDGLTASGAPSVRRQVAITVLWLLAGILIWIFWSVTFGIWIVAFGVIMLVVGPIVRVQQRNADERRGVR